MNLLAEVMPFLAAAGLTLFVGALLTEAMVLVPMWRTFQPQEFFTLHAAHAPCVAWHAKWPVNEPAKSR